jgi:subtilisin family serine protease
MKQVGKSTTLQTKSIPTYFVFAVIKFPGGSVNRIFKFVVVTFIVICFAAAPLAGVLAQSTGPAALAPLSIGPGNIVPNQYIVVLKPTAGLTVQASAISALEASGGKLIFQYGTALNGFAANLSDSALLELRANPQVDYIEADQFVSLGPDLGTAITDTLQADTAQSPATWGLDRIDQRALPLNNTYTYLNNGAGVNVYVLDSGILTTHTQFGGRANRDFDAIGDGQNGNDCNGHGTHVAGIIGGSTYGVAKAVKLHAVRILDCTGTGLISGFIAGINWVAANHIQPAVANMSVGSAYNPALNAAVNAAIASGVTFVVAASNENQNACNSSPASATLAITVGATASDDSRAWFSNWGPCLDIFAPGANITSAWIGSNTATATKNGTSMAAPHVAGAAALYLQLFPNTTPAAVADALIYFSTKGVVTDPVGSVQRLLYSQVGAMPVVPTPVAPSGSITDTTPGYNWTKIAGASQYQYQLYKGAALVYTQTVSSAVCNTTNCLHTPAAVLPFATYSWKVRALVGTWRAFSLPKTFTLITPPTVPTLLAPNGTITNTTPTYTWTMLPGAAQYQYMLYKGAALIYTQNVGTGICGATICASTPASTLGIGAYTWKIRALIGGIWKAFSAPKAFTLAPVAGFNSQFTSDAAGWTPQNGVWSVAGGSYKSSGLSSVFVSSAHANNYPTFTYEVRLMRTGCTGCANTIYFRGSPAPLGSDKDWHNGYEFGVSSSGFYYIGYYQNGVWNNITSWTTSALITANWNTLKVTANGTYMQFFINGTRVAFGNFSALSTGQVGVGYNRDASSTGNLLSIDYASLTLTAPASSPGNVGINLDESSPVTLTDHPTMAP